MYVLDNSGKYLRGRETERKREKYEKVKERTRSDINSFAENKGRLSIDLT